MSYEANVNGSIDLLEPTSSVLEQIQKNNPKYAKYTDLEKLINEEFNIDAEVNTFENKSSDTEVNEVKDFIDFYAYTKYNEDNYYDLLNLLLPYIAQPAEIFFKGEDDALWKLKVSNDEINEYAGQIKYDDEKITKEEMLKFLNNRDVKEYMYCDEGLEKLKTEKLNEFAEEVEATEKYWTSANLKKLLLAISLANYAYKCENESNEETDYPSFSFENAGDYIQAVINSQDVD